MRNERLEVSGVTLCNFFFCLQNNLDVWVKSSGERKVKLASARSIVNLTPTNLTYFTLQSTKFNRTGCNLITMKGKINKKRPRDCIIPWSRALLGERVTAE